MTEQKTTEPAAVNQQIEAISKRLTTLKDDLNKTHQEIVTCKEKRDKLNETVKSLRREISDIKKERDRLNESVKTLKTQRDEVRAQMAPFIEQIKEHSEKVRDLKAKRSGGRRQDLQKAFDALEFQIATTSLDLKEEKRLIDQVKGIEVQLAVYKKIDQHVKKINEIKAELKAFEDKADLYHHELTENAKKSQELHASMLGKFEEMKKLRDEATNLHLQFLLNKEKIKPLHDEIGVLWNSDRDSLGNAKNNSWSARSSSKLTRWNLKSKRKPKRLKSKRRWVLLFARSFSEARNWIGENSSCLLAMNLKRKIKLPPLANSTD